MLRSITDDIWDATRDAEIHYSRLLVLLAIGRLANTSGTYHGSANQIAEEARVSRSMVCRALNYLRTEKWIATSPRPGRGRALTYQLNRTKIAKRRADGAQPTSGTSRVLRPTPEHA